jgi:uncharacterized membrane protein
LPDPAARPSDTIPIPTQTRPRIESLSDLVFGLALSLGAFALIASPPSDAGTLYGDLLTFGFSFLILILVWLTYSRLLLGVTLESPRILALNIVLLFTVAIEPFLFDLLQSSNLSFAFFAALSQAYAIDVGAMMGVLGLLAWVLVAVGPSGSASVARQRYRQEALYKWTVAGLFFVSAAPIFVQAKVDGESVRVILWFVALAALLTERFTRMKVGRVSAPARV